MNVKKALACCMALFLLASVFLLSGCGAAKAEQTAYITSIEQLYAPGTKIGVETGSSMEELTEKIFSDAEILQYQDMNDIAIQVRNGNIAGFMLDTSMGKEMIAVNPDLAMLPLDGVTAETAFAFPQNEKGERLCAEMSAFIDSLEASGELDKIVYRWENDVRDEQETDYRSLPADNGTLTFAGTNTIVPFFYTRDNECVGIDMDIAIRFCREKGYGIDLLCVPIASVIASLGTQADVGFSGLTATEERKKTMYFSSPYYHGGYSMVVKKDTTAVSTSDITADFTSLEQFNDPSVNIGVMTASVYDSVTQKILPSANRSYYNTHSDLVQALKDKKIDAYMSDKPLLENIVAETPEVEIFPETCCLNETAAMFPKTEKGKALRDELNQFIAQCYQDGTIDELNALWLEPDAPYREVDIPTTGANGTVRMATYSGQEPFVFIKNNNYVGFEIDLIALFCKEKGYALIISDMDFTGVMAGILASKYDMAACSITVTDERKENVYFCDSYYKTEGRLLVRSQQAAVETEKGFWAKIGESFERTFIREERWRMVVSGILATLFISVMAALIGTLLGFGICMLRGLKNPFVHALTTGYIRIFQGTPVLVILMILFYIVFAKTGFTGEWVAIITFALNTAAYIAEIMRSGIDSIDKGQTEAALAAGYTRGQAFFRIVFPQALSKFLPVYRGEIISLVKSTSVVGYIAVEDLTKVSDIIRSRTYDAFFPLIVTAIIYFAISMLLSLLLTRLQKASEPKRRSRKLKGVTVK